jgi:MraZ protein
LPAGFLGWELALNERKDFIGHAVQAIDAKGRVAIPADLRLQMETNNGGRSLFLDMHEDESCLIGFDSGWVRARREQIARDEAFERDQGRPFDLAMARRDPFTTAEPVPFDASGRFILPPFLRDLAGLTNEAFFAGSMDYIEIWNPARVLDSPRASPRARRYVEWHYKQKGAS